MDRLQDQEETLFALALEKPRVERQAFLEGVCPNNPALRARLEELLAAHEQPETQVATPIDGGRATLKIAFEGPQDEAVGQVIGRYKLLEKVGEGGVGWCMWPSRLNRCAAEWR